MRRVAAMLILGALGCGARVDDVPPGAPARVDDGAVGSVPAEAGASSDVASRDDDAGAHWDGGILDGGMLPPGGATFDPPSTFALGFYDVCAWAPGGVMRCSGSNAYGELGDGTTTPRTTPAPVVDLRAVTAGARGKDHACAVDGGDLYCWGMSNFAGFGPGATAIPRPGKLLSGVRQVSAAQSHTCAVKTDGSVWCWGTNYNHVLGYDGWALEPRPVPGVVGALSVATSGSHACARFADGTTKCWGSNTSGECGTGEPIPGREWVPPTTVVGLTGIVQIGAGFGTSCARTADGRVWCWGRNVDNSLGEPAYISRSYPAPVPGLEGVQQMAIGAHFGCALLADRTVHCWGDDSFGQLGDGGLTYVPSTGPKARPVVGLTDVVEIAAGVGHMCARRGDGSAWCWGRNENGGLGDGTKTARNVPVAVPW